MDIQTKEISEIFTLNREKCVRCGMCVHDCAFGALKVDEESYPYFLIHKGACFVSIALPCFRRETP